MTRCSCQYNVSGHNSSYHFPSCSINQATLPIARLQRQEEVDGSDHKMRMGFGLDFGDEKKATRQSLR